MLDQISFQTSTAKKTLWSSILTATLLVLLSPFGASAFTMDSLQLGVGVYEENMLGKITKSADGSGSMMGSITYPIFLKYDLQVTSSWWISPQILYTPIGRESAGASTTTTILQLNLPVGFNLHQWAETTLDWEFGLGLNQRSMKGAGGSDTLLNGSTPTVFIRPSKTVTTSTVSFLLGSSVTYGSSRLGLDLIFDGLLSEKRAYGALLGYSYRIW